MGAGRSDWRGCCSCRLTVFAVSWRADGATLRRETRAAWSRSAGADLAGISGATGSPVLTLAGALQMTAAWDCDAMEKARRLLDLALVSVLLDAGAGPTWTFKEPGTEDLYSRSEGLGIASFHMFLQGDFSTDPANNPHRVDAASLASLPDDAIAKAFQVVRCLFACGLLSPLWGTDAQRMWMRRLRKTRWSAAVGGQIFFRLAVSSRIAAVAMEILTPQFVLSDENQRLGRSIQNYPEFFGGADGKSIRPGSCRLCSQPVIAASNWPMLLFHRQHGRLSCQASERKWRDFHHGAVEGRRVRPSGHLAGEQNAHRRAQHGRRLGALVRNASGTNVDADSTD